MKKAIMILAILATVAGASMAQAYELPEGYTFRYVEWDEKNPNYALAYCPGYERGTKHSYVVSCNFMPRTRMWDCRLIPRVNRTKVGMSAPERNVAAERACARIPR